MAGFTDADKLKFRVSREPGAEANDPYGDVIPGRFGHLYVHGPGRLGIATHRNGPVAAKIRGDARFVVTQDGEDGVNAHFGAEHIKQAAGLIRAKYKRKARPSQEHVAKLIEAGRKFRLRKGV